MEAMKCRQSEPVVLAMQCNSEAHHAWQITAQTTIAEKTKSSLFAPVLFMFNNLFLSQLEFEIQAFMLSYTFHCDYYLIFAFWFSSPPAVTLLISFKNSTGCVQP